MNSLRCTVSTPDGVFFEGDSGSIVVPAIDGEMGILPRHAPLIARLGWGEMRVQSAEGRSSDSVSRFFVEGGFLQVLEGQVNVLAVTVESLDTLPKAEAEARVENLVQSRPDPLAPFEERDAHEEKIRAARRRAQLARG